MDLYNKTPKPENKKGKAVALILLLAGALFFIIASNDKVAFASVIQVAAIVSFTASIYIAAAYLLREYTFCIQKNGNSGDTPAENYDFLVYDNKGKRQVKACHFEMKDITGVRVIDKSNRKEAEKERKAMKRYLYDCDYSPERFIELRAHLEGEDYSIYVTYDEELLRVLQSLIKQS